MSPMILIGYSNFRDDIGEAVTEQMWLCVDVYLEELSLKLNYMEMFNFIFLRMWYQMDILLILPHFKSDETDP